MSDTRIARGCWQRYIWETLTRNGEIVNPVSDLRGKAQRYSLNYKASFDSMLERASSKGFLITMKLGPRGGMTRATYFLSFGEDWSCE